VQCRQERERKGEHRIPDAPPKAMPRLPGLATRHRSAPGNESAAARNLTMKVIRCEELGKLPDWV